MEREGGRQRNQRGAQRERGEYQDLHVSRKGDPFSLLASPPRCLSPPPSPLIYLEPNCKANILKDEDRATEGPGDCVGQ